jgi:hypothetical protein
MRPVEAVAWADAFDVDVKDLPAVLNHEVARVDGVRTELAKLAWSFRAEGMRAPGAKTATGSTGKPPSSGSEKGGA